MPRRLKRQSAVTDNYPTSVDVVTLSRDDAAHLILDRHYAGKWPQVRHVYGFRGSDGEVEGVCTFGNPPNPYLRRQIAGAEFEPHVLELNRLVLLHNRPNEATQLMSGAMSMLAADLGGLIAVSYADPFHGHHGGIYRAGSWIDQGQIENRCTFDAILDGEHHHQRRIQQAMGRLGLPQSNKAAKEYYGDRIRFVRTQPKHRFVRIVGSKSFRRRALRAVVNR